MNARGKSLVTAATGLAAGPVTVALASATSPLVSLGLLLSIGLAGAMLVYPYLGLLVTVLVVPLERIGRLTNDSSTHTFSIMRALGLLNLAALALHVFLGRRRLRFPLPVILYFLYLMFGLLSLTQTTDSVSSIRATGAMIGNLMFFFVIPNLVTSREQVRVALACWLLITTGIGIFTIYRWHQGASVTDSRFHSTGERSTDERFAVVLEDHAEFDLGEKIPRALGPTSHPAVYAINTIMAIPFFAYFFRRSKSWLYRVLIAAAAVIAAYNIMLTNTRAAFIAFLVVALLLLAYRVVRLNVAMIAVGAILAIASIPFMPQALWDRIFTISNYSTEKSATMSARLLYWRAAVDVFEEHPFLGIGLGNQSEIPKKVTAIRMPPNSSTHNEYLNSLIEVGVFGYSVLLSFFVVLFMRCSKAEKIFKLAGDEDTVLIIRSAKAMFLAVLFYAIQVDCFHFPLKGWWLVMGLTMVLYQIAVDLRKQSSQTATS